MRLPLLIALMALATSALAGRPSNVTRGVYVHSRDLMPARIWAEYGSGYEFDAVDPHSGEASIRCENVPDGAGGGASQAVQVNQERAKPLKIAGWSRCEAVEAGEPGWQYSIYVDLTYADGTPWHMQIAPFERGTHGWQYSEKIIEPQQPVRSARVHLFLREIGGTVWFDDIFFGPPDGENLLRTPGFESDEMADASAREEVLANLDALNANTVHTYIGVPQDERDDEKLREMLAALDERGYGVVLTPHVPYGTFTDADDPAFPSYYCVNNDWGDRWVEACRTLAQYPFLGISVVPDEWNWNTGRLKRAYEKHPDERVREFYAALPTYCNCPKCQQRFAEMYGMPLPEMGHWSRPPEHSEAYRNLIDFRYRCTTDLVGRAVDAVHSGPYDTLADSLICVSPICSDFRLGTGVAWDMVGYETAIDYPTTDPYILLHNYLGDSTHWYVTETAMHLVGSTPRRQCGIVLEGGHLRPEHRPLLPVEIYGSALSSVARGADEIAFFHYVHLLRQSEAGRTQGESAFNAVRGCYELLERIDPWLEDARPVRRVALLYSRASEDYFSYYTHPEPELQILTHETDDPRYPFLAQKEVLYYLMRAGVPTDLYFLDQVAAEELADYDTIVVPFPFAVSEPQAAMLEGLARAGKQLIVISEFGSVDERGVPHERPVLLDLLGLAEPPTGAKTGRLRWANGRAGTSSQMSVYAQVTPPEDAEVLATVDGTPAVIRRALAGGSVTFLAGEFGIDLTANTANEKRDRTVRIMPAELSPGHARLLGELVAGAALSDDLVPKRDVELVLMENAAGDRLLFAINWEEAPVVTRALLERGGTGQALRVSADGSVSGFEATTIPDAGRFALPLRLAPQEAVVVRLPAG